MSKASKFLVVMVYALFVSFAAASLAEDCVSYDISVGDNKLSFVPQPQSGFVVKSREGLSSVNYLNESLRLSDKTEIKPVGGLDREGVSIVFRESRTGENEKSVENLRSGGQVEYAAPVFSLNGQTVAVIPEIIVCLKTETGTEEVEALCRMYGLTINKKMPSARREYLLDVSCGDADSVFAAVEQLNQNSMVKWASPNIAFQPQLYGEVIPNDEFFTRLWHLHNTGQTGGTPNADANVTEAWEITTGDPDIVIAIVDTGVDVNHPDLIDNIVPGYDFVEDDAIPEPGRFWPDEAHGTCCAGLAAARGNNDIGVVGVSWTSKIMPIRILSEEDYVTEADVATAIRWAAEHGADILSNSWGYLYPSQAIYSAITDVTAQGGIGRNGKGCIVVCASGNWSEGGPVTYPALYPEVIAVGAVDHDGEIWYYSGSGPELDIVAPSGGVQRTDYFLLGKPYLLTTDITEIYGYSMYNLDINMLDYSDTMGGTSGACPIVAGVAALVLSIDPNLTSYDAQLILTDSAADLGDPGFDESYGYGCVDAFAAVDRALNPPPVPPSQSITLYVDDDAPNDVGPCDSTIGDPLEDGSAEHPFDNIQEAVTYAEYAETIVVMPGTYSGQGNYDIDYLGKAVKIRGSGPDNTIIDCDNSGRGFYFHNRERNDSILDGVTITNGNAYYGGAVNCADGSSPIISNCVFKDNWAVSWGSKGGYGGAVYNGGSSNPTYRDCKFIDNLAVWYGAGMFNSWSSPNVTNCLFEGNLCGAYGAGMFNDNGRPVINNCSFIANSAQTWGGGMFNSESSPTLSGCTFSENSTIDWDGGAMLNMYSDPVAVDCEFRNNTAGDWGGAICNLEGSLVLANCAVIANSTGSQGGAFYNDASEITMTNCVIAGNAAGQAGGGAYCDGSTMTLTNCTFASNSAESGKAFVSDTWWYTPSSFTLANCILWDGSDEIWNNDNSTFDITYSDVMTEGDEPWAGDGNINANPLFADVNGGDYHLKSQAGRWDPISQSWVHDDVTSPCIDAGDPAASVGSEPQPNGDVVNMGAYGGTPEASLSQ